MTKKKEPLTIRQIAELLAMKAFGRSASGDKWLHELQFIMGRGGNKPNDSVPEVLEDILKNV